MGTNEYRVIVVDDERTTLKLVDKYLEMMEFKYVELERDGEKAYQKICLTQFDLIISDWNMPGLTGVQLFEAVRKISNRKDTPFILLTAQSEKEDVLEALKTGIKNYIIKDTIGYEEVKEKILKVLADNSQTPMTHLWVGQIHSE